MKKFGMLLSLAMVLIMAACGGTAGGNSEAEKVESDATAQQIMERIEARLEEEGNGIRFMDTDMSAMEDSLSPLITQHFDSADIESGEIRQAMMMVHSDLIMVIRAKDTAAAERVRESFDKVHEDQVATWSIYLQDQYEFVENAIIEQRGVFLLYAVTEHAEAVRESFEDSILAD